MTAANPSANPPETLRYAVRIDGNAHHFLCAPDQRLLVAMEAARGSDIMRRWMATIPVGCRRGGCGVCRIRVLDGDYETGAMSADHVSPGERADGYALACCVYPRGPLTVSLAPRHPNQVRAMERAQADPSQQDPSQQERAAKVAAEAGGND